jgi:RNA polymerase sigma-70 factor (ECF subfamily)
MTVVGLDGPRPDLTGAVPCARRHHQPHGHRRPADDLARRFAAGDERALREVVATYSGLLLTTALHLLGRDRRLADEAVQTALVKAWRAAHTFDPVRPLAPWLYSILRRAAIDLWRQEQRHRGSSLDAPETESAAIHADGSDRAATAWVVREALGALPPDEHTLMRLIYFEGLSHPEVAERLAIPVGTVKSRTARAHRRLRTRLEAQLAHAG